METVNRIVPELIRSGRVTRPRLGVQIADEQTAQRLGVTGVRTAALQGGYFVGAAVGGAALALGGYAALGLTMAALFGGAAAPHLLSARPESPQPYLP